MVGISLGDGPTTIRSRQRDSESCRNLGLIPNVIPAIPCRFLFTRFTYHTMRFYGGALKFTRIVVKV